MQIPAIGEFRKESGSVYGRPWSVDPVGADFTLTIPAWQVLFDDEDECQPDEPSYQLALQVIADLDGVREKAVEYLARIVDAQRWGMHGGTYFTHVVCDANAREVTVALSWENNIYAEWSVTFVVSVREGATAHAYHPVRMGYRYR